MQVTIVATSTNAALAMGISVSKSGVNNGNVMNPGIAESTHYASTSIAAKSYISFDVKTATVPCLLDGYTVEVVHQ